jgi:hypothetical protein
MNNRAAQTVAAACDAAMLTPHSMKNMDSSTSSGVVGSMSPAKSAAQTVGMLSTTCSSVAVQATGSSRYRYRQQGGHYF